MRADGGEVDQVPPWPDRLPTKQVRGTLAGCGSVRIGDADHRNRYRPLRRHAPEILKALRESSPEGRWHPTVCRNCPDDGIGTPGILPKPGHVVVQRAARLTGEALVIAVLTSLNVILVEVEQPHPPLLAFTESRQAIISQVVSISPAPGAADQRGDNWHRQAARPLPCCSLTDASRRPILRARTTSGRSALPRRTARSTSARQTR